MKNVQKNNRVRLLDKEDEDLSDGEIDDDEYGFLSAGNLSAQKARILAKLALTQTNNLEKIKEIFNNY